MAAFGAGNIVVYRVGTGAAAASSAATAAFLDEYTQAGVLVQSIALPTTANSTGTGNDALTASGTATSEGQISDSGNGQALLVAGYNITAGTTGSASGSTASTTANQRVIGVVNAQGTIDSTTNVGTFDSGNNARSAASADGTNLYIGTPNGVAYTTDGSTTTPTTTAASGPTVVDTANTRATQVDIFNGTTTLFYSTSANGGGIYSLGRPPTANVSTSTTTDPGTLLASSTSPYGFFFANLGATLGAQPDTLYVADSTNGVEKFSLNGNGTYAANGTLALSNATGITGVVNDGFATLFATTPAGLYKFTDAGGSTGALAVGTGSTTTPLVAAPTNEAFRSDAQAPVCFVSGTLIRTVQGDIAVERLAVGDLVVTASGHHRPIRWIGHQTHRPTGAMQPRSSWPVRVAAGAFGDALPSADLFLSPGHSVCLGLFDEVLVPIQELVNGATVAYVDTDEVTYWHVELDSHDILVANNLPAESFLEMGVNRAMFATGRGLGDPSAEVLGRSHDDFCRRFVDRGPLLAAMRDELRIRTERRGWTASRDVAIKVEVDGRHLAPVAREGEVIVALPPGAGEIRLCSTMTTPTLMGLADARAIGVAVYAIDLIDAEGATRTLDLDGPELAACFHSGERHEGLHYRFTSGDIVVPAGTTDGLTAPVVLRLTYEPSTLRGWKAPEPVWERPKLRAVA